MRKAQIVSLFLVAVFFSFVAEAKPPRGPSKAAIEKLVKECEATTDTALPEEVSYTTAIAKYAGVEIGNKAEVGALVKVVRTVKSGNKQAMSELEHGFKSKPGLNTILRPQVAAFFHELGYFMFIGKGETKDDARDSRFTKGFLVAMYMSNWGNPHTDEACAKQILEDSLPTIKFSDERLQVQVESLIEARIIRECTVRDEQEVVARHQRFCQARRVFTDMAGYDPLSASED